MSDDPEARRRFAEEYLARAEEEARRDGKSEAEIAVAHQRVEEYLDRNPGLLPTTAAVGDLRRRSGRPPDVGPGWLMSALRHPVAWRACLVLLIGVLGYFGLDRGRYGSPQPFPSGAPGFLYGCGLGLVVVLAAQALVWFRRR